ncbi:MAG: DegT/DnrJ/EryC1/StrS family aminotransferase [Phycisphaerales bacterium]|nr:DegT/DnrJ/EryC1/StrS family aminotransferase [Phycisphaerales bacterium]
MSRIPLSQHDLLQEDLRLIGESIGRGESLHGPDLNTVEEMLAERTSQGEAITTATYLDAARILLMAMDIQTGDEVVLPAFASGVMTQAVVSVGATPIYADCHPRTLNINPQSVEACCNSNTRAIIATCIFGNPAGLPQLAALCGLLEVPLIEDLAGGLGSTIDRRSAGSFGRASIVDLGTRTVAGCGEGGGICTSDQRTADRCRLLRKGIDLEPLRGEQPGALGHRSHLTNMQAAMLLPQLQRLDDIMESRALVAAMYTQRLAGVSDVIVPTVDPGTTLGWPEFVIRLDESYTAEDRNEVVQGLDRHEIGAARPWTPPPHRPQVAARLNDPEGEWPVAEFVSQRTIGLPMYSGLTERDTGLVTQTLELMMQRATFRRS